MNGVKVHGPLNLSSDLSVHASEMYAKNIYNLSKLLIKSGELAPDWTDEVLAGALLTHQGEITHKPTKELAANAS